MKYFILLLCATSFCIAQTNFKKPYFVWENTYTEGMMAAGLYKFIRPFSHNSFLAIGEQVNNKEFSRNTFQCFDISTGIGKWIKQDSIQGIYLNTPNSPEHYYQTSMIDSKIIVSTLTKPAGDLPSTYSFRRSFSIYEDGESQFERLFSDGMQIHRGFHLNRINDREYCYLSINPDSTNSGLENVLFHNDNNGKVTTTPINRFSTFTMSQWNVSNAWKRSENTIELLIASAFQASKHIALYTINLESKTASEIMIPSEMFGIPDKQISIESSLQFENDYYFILEVKNNVPQNKLFVKMDNNGNVLKIVNISNYSNVNTLISGPNNSILLCGSIFDPEEVPFTSSNQWICQYNSDLVKMNEFIWGTDKPDNISSAYYLNGTGLLIGGQYNKIDNSSDFVSHANIGLIPESVFLGVSSVAENKSETLTIQIVEDASSNSSLVVNSKHQQTVTIKLLDANGRLVSVVSTGILSVGENRFTLPTSLSNGMYLVSCEQNGTILSSEKFIIKK